MESTFEVPGEITYADVRRPSANESAAMRLRRLAMKATIEGCKVLALANTEGLFAVTSGTVPDTAYVVDTYRGTCGCAGFSAGRACKHIAITLYELGEMPDPSVYVDRADALAAIRAGDGRWNAEVTLEIAA